MKKGGKKSVNVKNMKNIIVIVAASLSYLHVT